MAKAMLIMDMPSSCNVCRYCEVHVRKRCLISACKLLPFSRIDKEKIHERQEWCPLREIPSKHEDGHTLKVAIENDCYDDTVQDDAWCEGVDKGYNACIDEILGGGE